MRSRADEKQMTKTFFVHGRIQFLCLQIYKVREFFCKRFDDGPPMPHARREKYLFFLSGSISTSIVLLADSDRRFLSLQLY